jgi:hypothetical protein
VIRISEPPVPAADAFSFLSLLQLIVALGPKIPKAMELLKALYDLFATEIEAAIPAGGLELVADTDEELALIGQISEALSADGTQAAFDGSRLRGLVKFLNDSGLGSLLVGILTQAAAGR